MVRTARWLLLAAAALGCATEDLAVRGGVPGARAPVSLYLEGERGDYLDVVMQSESLRFRFFLPNDEVCRGLFANEQQVTYANVGPLGRLQAGESVCDPVGILSLAEWRDRRPRGRTTAVIPRSRSELRQRVYADEDLTLVRGRFLLAREIGFAGGGDAIAVLPNQAACAGLAVPGSASMEYRPAGKKPFTLIHGNQLCPVLGFVQPPPNP